MVCFLWQFFFFPTSALIVKANISELHGKKALIVVFAEFFRDMHVCSVSNTPIIYDTSAYVHVCMCTEDVLKCHE